MSDPIDIPAPTVLVIEGMPTSWAVTINNVRAFDAGSTPLRPEFLVRPGRAKVVATMGGFKKTATLQIGRGENFVPWSEFRSVSNATVDTTAIASVSVAAVTAAVVYLARR